VRQLGRVPQTSSNVTSNDRYAVSGPLILTAKPLNPHHRQLLTNIEQLKLDQWSDRKIAKCFNERTMLTPRGVQVGCSIGFIDENQVPERVSEDQWKIVNTTAFTHE
jgi:hypothetical protein